MTLFDLLLLGAGLFVGVYIARALPAFLVRPLWRLIARPCEDKPRVVDGDSLILGPSRRARLYGLDAPELGTIDGHAVARSLAARLHDARSVRIAHHGRCRYGRDLVTVYADGANVNAWLVASGQARAYTRYTHAYSLEQAFACLMRRGLWRRGWFFHPETTRHT